MSFKTIVITKKKIVYAALILLSAAIGTAVGITALRGHTAEVFNMNTQSYEEILEKGLPDNSEKDFSIKRIAGKMFGLSFDEPEVIISEYSSVFDRTNYSEDEENDTDNEPQEENAAEEEDIKEETTEIELPDNAAICSSTGLELNNATDYDVNIDDMCAEELSIHADSDEPQVLVVHTHTTECYNGDEMNGETERNTDENLNVVAVGNEICAVLEKYGIKTVHDTTYHDYPSYQGSYTRALSTIESNLKNYPSIKVVLDVHRDAFVYEDGTKLTVSCEENGIPTAKVMIVTGSDSMGLWHENWRENLKFAAKIQNAAEIMYPNLMRPINLRTERFNGHTTKGSLILEVGSNGNTLDEAKEGGRDVARAIAAVLLNG